MKRHALRPVKRHVWDGAAHSIGIRVPHEEVTPVLRSGPRRLGVRVGARLGDSVSSVNNNVFLSLHVLRALRRTATEPNLDLSTRTRTDIPIVPPRVGWGCRSAPGGTGSPGLL